MSDEELAKDLGPLAALTIGVGTMIGAGIFVLPGDAVTTAGSLAVAAFVIGGAIALLTALSASELGTAMPKSGGAYFYVNHALGPLFGSIAGWANWLGLAFASAFYMVGFGEYVQLIVGVSGTVGLGPVSLNVATLIALVGGAFFVGVNYIGAKETGVLQNVIVIILVAILAVFTFVGGLQADISNLPANEGFGPMFTATGFIFVSYLGFVQITSVAEEIKEPGKNLPRAVIGSVVLVTAIYALVLFVMSASLEPGFIAGVGDNEIAVVEVADVLLGPVGAVAMLFGGLLATASSANASILASSRINFAMGRDEIVSQSLNEIHPRFATPYKSIAITGGMILAFILAGDLVGGNAILTLSGAASFLHLVIYGLLNVALVVMRTADPEDYQPDFRVPLYPITPIVGSVASFALIAYIEPGVRLFGTAIIAASALWYVLYARTRTTKQGILSEYILDRSESMPSAAVSAAETVKPDGGEHRVMVALANPKHEKHLVTLASGVANQHDGVVDAVHIVTVPDQTSLEYAADNAEEYAPDHHAVLDDAKDHAETFGVDIETHTIFSHRGFEEIFDAAQTHDADTVVMGWGPDSHGSPGRAESALDDLTSSLSADFLVVRDRDLEPDNIVVPTRGGPGSAYAAQVGSLIQDEYDSELTLLHVADSEAKDADFLEEWATEQGLSDATLRVEYGDTGEEIVRAAEDASLLILGASERGLLVRLVSGSPVQDVVDEVDCSVILAEQANERSLLQRLLGR
ncbi:Amino acid transporter [Halovenus aranensis]|uniref:Amino acid transporter n=1 Tax=Halovenus aranensis TaxID=890420 RepID=A0A1G8XT13_9EURY|nr:amino acid permease [Halovenus aranensis]SDJ93729.1 Amino acid transporter [Halovenus aranensis]